MYSIIVITVSLSAIQPTLEIIAERASDISFANEARRIYDVVFRTVKRRMFAVMQPNSGHPYLSQWNGVHVDLETLGVADSVPEVLRDVTLSFVWGTPDSPVEFGAAWVTPRSGVPDGAIIIGYNVGKRDRQPFRISKAAKRARAKLGQMSKGSELHEDEDIIALIPQLFSARRTAFIHELRHAYDQLVRDDDGKMGDYMNDRLMSSDDSIESNFTTDDEMNAYITQGMEDTIEDFERHSRGRPTKDKAKRWAPSGTALWNRFSDNVSGAVKHFTGEEKLMRRAAARVADVWDDYVANLNEGHVISESFDDMQLIKMDFTGPNKTRWALTHKNNVVAGMTTFEGPDEWHIVDTMWANSSQSAYALMMGVLANSLGLVPSKDVSVAAESVIKRWYDRHSADQEYVIEDPLQRGSSGALNAGYLPGPSVRSPVKIKRLKPGDQQRAEIAAAVQKGFAVAYDDKNRTTKPGGAMRKTESRLISEIDEDLEDVVAELMKLPEFASIEAFAEAKIEDEQETYSTAELQALARNLYVADNKTVKARDLVTAPSSYREKVKKELEGYGLLFSARRAPKRHRGFSDPVHGSNRYAGNHGGSGFDNAYNREPSSGRTFDPKDSGSLGMGSKRGR